jgi:hypothetical protein
MLGGIGGFSAAGESGGLGRFAADGRKWVFTGGFRAVFEVKREVVLATVGMLPPNWRRRAAPPQGG